MTFSHVTKIWERLILERPSAVNPNSRREYFFPVRVNENPRRAPLLEMSLRPGLLWRTDRATSDPANPARLPGRHPRPVRDQADRAKSRRQRNRSGTDRADQESHAS